MFYGDSCRNVCSSWAKAVEARELFFQGDPRRKDGASSAEPTGRIGDKENGAESVGGVDVYEQRAQVRWDRDGQG